MVERLELTSEQIKRLKDADFAFRKTHFELKAQWDLLHLELEKAFTADTADEASIQKVAQKLADVKGKIFLQFIFFRLKTDKILTPEQQDAHMQEVEERREEQKLYQERQRQLELEREQSGKQEQKNG